MKNKLLLNNRWSFWMLLLGIVFFSCENEEEGLRADQSQDDPAPLSVNFTTSSVFLEVSTTNTSANGRAYAWDFGVEDADDDTSIEFEPSYTYEADGTYTITLVVKGEGGQEEIVTREVTVGREMINPSASFTSEIDFLDVAFTNTSVNGVSYEWDFGDGAGTSTEENPSYSYAAGGTYTVSLIATSRTDDTDTVTEMITVEPRPVAPVADFTFVATNLDVEFTDASLANDGNITAYAWDFGDGTGTSALADPSYSYGAAGTYQVALTITFDDVLGETSSTTTQSVSVTADPGLQATFAAALQNGDMQTYPTAEQNNNDLVDAWTIDPDNTFNDNSDTPFNFWRNDDLEAFVTAIGGTDKASSSGTDATSAGGTSDRSYKMDSAGERAYQPFEVETGVLYSISAFVKSETTPVGNVEGTFYILSDQPSDETDLASIALATVPVTSNGINEWQQISFSFIAESTFNFPQSRVDESIATGGILTSVDQEFVILYFAPTSTVTGDNEVFLTDVEIETPSLN
ncbi:PKD domain-containing protein [Croceitalea marina]|uniref:PKD domain-containing protein n=1 Tax=Croceitalea marina TaxID=1775166 RepID=A0ABW5N0T5_9FLAO